jgi:hypothetical protein
MDFNLSTQINNFFSQPTKIDYIHSTRIYLIQIFLSKHQDSFSSTHHGFQYLSTQINNFFFQLTYMIFIHPNNFIKTPR